MSLKLRNKIDVPHKNVVAATSNGVFLIKNGEYSIIESGKGIYYGITKFENGFIVSCRSNEDGAILLFFNHEAKVYKEVKIKEVTDVHEIFYAYRKVWLTNTGQDNIYSYDIDNNILKHESWLGSTQHVNSISINKGNFYILGLTNSILKIFNEHGQIYEKMFIASGAHTVKTFNDVLFICNSTTCSVSLFNLSKEFEPRKFMEIEAGDKSKFFARGFACDDKNFYFGLSVKEEREFRHGFVDSKICIASKKTLDYQEIFLNCSGQIGDFILL